MSAAPPAAAPLPGPGEHALPVDATWFSRADLGGGITMIEELRADQRLRGTLYAVEDAGGRLLLTAQPHADFDVDAFRPVPTTPARPVGGGDVVGVGTRQLTVVHPPGQHRARRGQLHRHDGADADLDVGVLLAGHGSPLDRARMVGLIDRYL